MLIFVITNQINYKIMKTLLEAVDKVEGNAGLTKLFRREFASDFDFIRETIKGNLLKERAKELLLTLAEETKIKVVVEFEYEVGEDISGWAIDGLPFTKIETLEQAELVARAETDQLGDLEFKTSYVTLKSN